MPIVSSSVVTDRVQSGGMRKIREEHTDSLGDKHYRQFIAASDYDAVTGLLVGAEDKNKALVSAEIARAIAEYKAGGDPLHFEASANNWQKLAPDHQTWDALAASVLIHFLELENRNDLAAIATTIIRINTNDKKALLGMTNKEVGGVNTSIQMAVDAVADLAGYSPYFTNGVKN